jgi:hypothetical protein
VLNADGCGLSIRHAHPYHHRDAVVKVDAPLATPPPDEHGVASWALGVRGCRCL